MAKDEKTGAVTSHRRIRPSARYVPNDKSIMTRGKPIMVSIGRGDGRLTTDEAIALRDDLYRAIVAALSGPNSPEAARASGTTDGTHKP